MNKVNFKEVFFSFFPSWIMTLTDYRLKGMKKVLAIAPWTELSLSGDEKIKNEKGEKKKKRNDK